jgi:hypothetical protein
LHSKLGMLDPAIFRSIVITFPVEWRNVLYGRVKQQRFENLKSHTC